MSKNVLQDTKDNVKRDQVIGAHRELLEQLFDDHYKYRWRVYKMNFVRGIFFGLGSVIGATIIVSFVIWILTLLNVPDNLIESIETKQSQTVQQ
ncbi:MAG: DUF5665 domain-containing protein [Candidatus Saccharibacteria bacterium]|nr:DUF5665 domain-containing protein [Candidatus Saccharibacteria bacterium]